MHRREFITLVGGAAGMWPHAARAQKQRPVIGFLGSQVAAPPPKDPQTIALHQGFLDFGLIEDRDFTFEQRFTDGVDERFPEFARDLARLNARMILANTPAGVRAVQRLDPPIPVVMVIMNDPVGAGQRQPISAASSGTRKSDDLPDETKANAEKLFCCPPCPALSFTEMGESKCG